MGRAAAATARYAVTRPSTNKMVPRITALQRDARVSDAGRSTNTRHPNVGMSARTEDTVAAGPVAPNVLPSIGSSETAPPAIAAATCGRADKSDPFSTRDL